MNELEIRESFERDYPDPTYGLEYSPNEDFYQNKKGKYDKKTLVANRIFHGYRTASQKAQSRIKELEKRLDKAVEVLEEILATDYWDIRGVAGKALTEIKEKRCTKQ